MTKAVISGCFSDFRIIRGRKVAVVSIELPIEQADEALRTLGGFPNPAEERWVAIALMSLEPKPPPDPVEPVEGKRKWEEMPPSQQCAIRCNEPEFRRFIKGHLLVIGDDIVGAVRSHCCGINSRRELDSNREAAELWRLLDDEYFKWSRGLR